LHLIATFTPTSTPTGRAVCRSTQALTIAGLVDFSMVHPTVLRIASERGRLVHHATAVIDRGDSIDDYVVPDHIGGYIEGYHAFLREMKFVPDPDWIERPMIVELFGHRVGMTPDAVGTIARSSNPHRSQNLSDIAPRVGNTDGRL
jgi:hypothetical protein